MSKLIPKKQTAWGKLEYKGPQYSQVIELMKKEDPQAYNRLLVANARSLQPNSEVVRWTDANGKELTSTTNIGMSGADPVGLLYVEGVVLNPVFKGLGRAAEYGLAKAGNKLARARLLSRAIDSKSTTYLNNTPQAYKKLSSKQLPKDLSLLYHLNYGTSKLTDKGLIPGKSNNGEDYLWWKEGSLYGNFPERNVYTIPKHKADIVTRGNSEGINPNGDYPLTKEVPLEELTEYSINPMTYGFEKRIFIKPNKPSKRLIMDDKTIPAYFGKKYSVNPIDKISNSKIDEFYNVPTKPVNQKFNLPEYAIPNTDKDPLDLHADRLIKGGFDRIAPSNRSNSLFYNIYHYDRNPLDYLDNLVKDFKLISKDYPDEILYDLAHNTAVNNNAMALSKSGNIYIGKNGMFKIFNDSGGKPKSINRTISHEVDHAIHVPEEKAYGFNLESLKESYPKTYNYFNKNNNSELSARGSLIKDYFGLDSPDLEITEDMLKYAAQNYVKDTGMDNNMLAFFNSISNWKEASKWLSKYSTMIGTPLGVSLIPKSKNTQPSN